MTSKISRRTFLKGGLAAAGTLAVSGACSGVAEADTGGQLATLIDIRKCTGCEECVHACRESNAHKFPDPRKPFPRMYPSRVKVEDWSEKRDTTDRLTPYNWLFIQHADVTVDGRETALTIPRRCMHCVNPPCVKLCPWGAARQYKNGISRIDSDLCLGGSKCRKVCPWHIPQRQTGVGLYLDLLPSLAGNGVMYKCDRCHERVAKGERPACIEACPEQVQSIGPRDEIIRRAEKIAREIGGFMYGEKENGGTNTIYVSPVSFEQLNQGIRKEKGVPHLSEAPDAMARAENLTAAMIAAPVAGIAAAAGKFFKFVRSGEKKE